MNITKLDDTIEALGNDAPALAQKPTQPISVEEAIALTHPVFNPSSVPLCFLDAVMYNGSFETKDKNGKTIKINPDGKFKATIKDNDLCMAGNVGDEAKTLLLENVIKALLQSEMSWDSTTAWNYAKLSTHLSFAEVTSYCERRFKEMAAQGKIKILNSLETPIVYGK